MNPSKLIFGDINRTYATVIADSVSPTGKRLTTLELQYPYIIHGQVMSHRDRERNGSSQRAIPISKMIERVRNYPYIPRYFPSAQKGMKGGKPLFGAPENLARGHWEDALESALRSAEALKYVGVHKEIANRLLAPFQYQRLVMTATEWANWNAQRLPLQGLTDAQEEISQLAVEIERARRDSQPERLSYYSWHLPYVSREEVEEASYDLGSISEGLYAARKLSAARCARVSYLTHENVRDISEDIRLYDETLTGGSIPHLSPMGHQATPSLSTATQQGPLLGWDQARHFDADKWSSSK